VNASQSYPNLGLLAFGRGVFEKPDIDGLATSANTLYRVRSGQFIYSRLFAFEGAFSIVPPKLDRFFVSNEFPVFDIIESKMVPGFVRWMFRQPDVWRAAASRGVGMGDRRRRVHPEALLTLLVPLPPLAEQARIVARLDGAAERLERRAAAAKAVEAELDATLRAAFRRLTAGAPEVRLSDVAPLVRRPVMIEAEKNYTEIGVRSFFRGAFIRRTVPGTEFSWQDLFAIEEGDLVFSNLMAWEGAVALATAEHHGCVGNHRMLTCAVDPARATPEFIHFHFRQPEGVAQLVAASPGSIARNRTLGPKALADLRIPLPSLAAQHTFGRLQAKATAALAAQRAATEHLDKLLPAMLHEAFGETASAEPLAAE
jgi:type I restriction enzyme S subunit